MLIEDDEILRDLCVTKLKKENYEVITAIDGAEGLRKIEEEKPMIVLLDIILPGMDGFEILKKIRASKSAIVAKTPVILLTNLGQENDIKKGEALGAEDYIVKANSTTEEIITKIKKALGGKNKKK
ncbi:response regulator [bacterium (Candidatus Torokbacteria) CG09_land_8_20_14_0_10_42_11]|nr:MAG: response regulator [bacterium (Candidatus Torokbacteria) CG09_land_8_20_14_0_10_42_11]